MDTPLRYTLRPSLRSVLVSFFVHHNPFFLLSAFSMVAGCFALNSDLDTHSGDLGKLLVLVGTLNFYEALVIGLALYLIRARGTVRDGRTLLLIEAPFLVDLAFLNAETAQVGFTAGALVNGIVLALALVKVAVVAKVLTGRLPRRSVGFVAAELAVLFTLPSVFRRLDHGFNLSPGNFYAAWWVVGMLPVLFEVMRQLGDRVSQTAVPAAVMRTPGLRVWSTIGALYVVLPFVSLVAHLGMLHWVYRVEFYLGNVAPILLGLAVLVARVTPANASRAALAGFLRTVLPAAAVSLTLLDAPTCAVRLTSRADLTPAVLSVCGAYLAYVYAFLLPYAAFCVAGGAAAVGLVLFGPTPSQIATTGWGYWQRTAAITAKLVPHTAIQWGAVAMGSAFAFLGIGAWVSLRRPPVEEGDAAPPPATVA